MANSATLRATVPAAIKLGNPKGLIYAVEVTADTSASLTLFTPSADKYAICIGMIISQVGAFTGTFGSASTELCQLDIAANSPTIIKPIGKIILAGNLGEALTLTRSANTLAKALMYFAETGRLVPGY